MDDLTILEVITLANVGLASHNIRNNIPSNIASLNQFIPSEHLKTQEYVKSIIAIRFASNRGTEWLLSLRELYFCESTPGVVVESLSFSM